MHINTRVRVLNIILYIEKQQKTYTLLLSIFELQEPIND